MDRDVIAQYTPITDADIVPQMSQIEAMEVDLVMLMQEHAWSKDEMAELWLQVATVMEMFKTFREQVVPTALVLRDPNARDEMAQLQQQVRMLTDEVETLR